MNPELGQNSKYADDWSFLTMNVDSRLFEAEEPININNPMPYEPVNRQIPNKICSFHLYSGCNCNREKWAEKVPYKDNNINYTDQNVHITDMNIPAPPPPPPPLPPPHSHPHSHPHPHTHTHAHPHSHPHSHPHPHAHPHPHPLPHPHPHPHPIVLEPPKPVPTNSVQLPPPVKNDTVIKPKAKRRQRNLENRAKKKPKNPENKNKKRQRHPEQWKKNMKKMQVNLGLSYISESGKVVSSRLELKSGCNKEKCKLKCQTKFSDQERKGINEQFWGLGRRDLQRFFVAQLVEPLKVKYRRVRPGSNRSINMGYYFTKKTNEKVRVCKRFFLDTLNIGSKFIENAWKNRAQLGSLREDKRGKYLRIENEFKKNLKKNIRDHISSFTQAQLNTVRAQVTKPGPEGTLNICQMYRLYKQSQEEKGLPVAKENMYRHIFNNEFNPAKPKKEQKPTQFSYDLYKNPNLKDKIAEIEKQYTELLEKAEREKKQEKLNKNKSGHVKSDRRATNDNDDDEDDDDDDDEHDEHDDEHDDDHGHDHHSQDNDFHSQDDDPDDPDVPDDPSENDRKNPLIEINEGSGKIRHSTDENDKEKKNDVKSTIQNSDNKNNNNKPVNNNTTNKKKRRNSDGNSKKRERQPELWKKNMKKLRVNSGLAYISESGKLVNSRKQLKSGCIKSKCKLKCQTKFSETDRKNINEQFWALGRRDLQKYFLAQLVEPLYVKYRRVRPGSNRSVNMGYYFFTESNEKTRVCKRFFLDTLNIGSKFIENVQKKKSHIAELKEDKRGKYTRKESEIRKNMKKSIRDHINSFPRLELNCLRAPNNKEYLDGSLSICEMYRLYKQSQEQKGLPVAKENTYRHIFNNEFNIAFYKPEKKDQKKSKASNEQYKHLNIQHKPEMDNQYKKYISENAYFSSQYC